MQATLHLLAGGAASLASYLAAHVLLCLLPAFFIAGAMAALIPKSTVTRWLGRDASPAVAYPAAAAAGSLLAVCSCTVVPLFAGIHRRGAGLGPAITFLFFAPAGNIMALSYTANVLGGDLAFARVLFCLLFGVGIGLLMARLFWRGDVAQDERPDRLLAGDGRIDGASVGLLLSLTAVLLAGTLRLSVLSAVLGSTALPAGWAGEWQQQLLHWVPVDAAKGEEGVSVQGSMLIVLLAAVGAVGWRGLENITERANRWTFVALALAGLTLLAAALRIEPGTDTLRIAFTVRALAVAAALAAVLHFARRLRREQQQAWLWESWRFVKQIFPLLLVGVFAVGVMRQLVPTEWIRTLAGENDLAGNAVAVLFGVFMYFPTLVEVPVARMFLDLGMHPGPLLAYLMADPELSLQSMLMVAAVIGWRRTAAYVALVALFSMVAGALYGAWVDGALAPALAAAVCAVLLLLGLVAAATGQGRMQAVRFNGGRR